MRRREQREHIFKLLFISEFNTQKEMEEQLALYLADIEKWDHIEEKNQLKGVVDNLKKSLTSAWKGSDELFDLDRQALFAAIADA